jgi:hypothetical protein
LNLREDEHHAVTHRDDVKAFLVRVEPLGVCAHEQEAARSGAASSKHVVPIGGVIPTPACAQEARMVLKALKVSLSLIASVASLFAVSWVGLALLGY